MADLKISALPASTTPLAGTEVLPIVQSSTTKQVSVANLTAGRAISATAVTASTGNFIVGTSGQGIDFSATAGTGTSELLADYEEGTWTPVISDGTNNATMSGGTSGRYTKVGRQVTVVAYVAVTSLGSVSGSILLTGLPFTVNGDDGSRGSASVGFASGLAILAGSSVTGVANGSSTRVAMFYWSSISGTAGLSSANLSASTAFLISLTYFV